MSDDRKRELDEQHDAESSDAVSSDDKQQEAPPGLVREFFEFLIRDAVWWLLAILVVLSIIGVVIFLTADRPMPFIYQD
jgi:hypothetical protein